MELLNSTIKDLYIIQQKKSCDPRGSFFKFFTSVEFKRFELETDFKEVFVSVSKINTIRGMHFQLPPFEQDKVVTVLKGKILDVVLDLRVNSPTYGKFEEFILTDDEPASLYVGKGLAHGFLSLKDNSMVCYLSSEIYNPGSDSGIKWNSFGFDWGVKSPIVSERDTSLPLFKKFDSPFLMRGNQW